MRLFVTSVRWLIYTRIDTYTCEKQDAKFLTITADIWGLIVPSSIVGAHKLVTSDRNQNRKIASICMTYEIPLYYLTD